MGSDDKTVSIGNAVAQPALRDAAATASYDYDVALMEYQTSLASRDRDKQSNAQIRLREATQRLALAQSALTSYQARLQRPSFDELLNDPFQQLDIDGIVMASVFDYRVAVRTTASASPAYLEAPPEARAAQYVHEMALASTVAATA